MSNNHSDDPLRICCPFCEKTFTAKHVCQLHINLKHSNYGTRVNCPYCSASFTRKNDCQEHIKRIHLCILTTNDRYVNLELHLQSLSEGADFMEEWIFVQAIPAIKSICPCGQTRLKEHFIIENRLKGNQTSSKCIRKFNEKLAMAIEYFKQLLAKGVKGTYKGQGTLERQRFEVNGKTNFVKKRALVEGMHLPLKRNAKGCWEIQVESNKDHWVVNQHYHLWLQTLNDEGHIRFLPL